MGYTVPHVIYIATPLLIGTPARHFHGLIAQPKTAGMWLLLGLCKGAASGLCQTVEILTGHVLIM